MIRVFLCGSWSVKRFGGHLCEFSIVTSRNTYGPIASRHNQCSDVKTGKITTLNPFLQKRSSIGRYNKLLLINKNKRTNIPCAAPLCVVLSFSPWEKRREMAQRLGYLFSCLYLQQTLTVQVRSMIFCHSL